jgi:hypothetical protein
MSAIDQYDVYIVFFKKTGCSIAAHVVSQGTQIPDFGESITSSVLVGHDPDAYGLAKDKKQLGVKFDKMRNYRLVEGKVVYIPDDRIRDVSLERLKMFRCHYFA